MASTIIQCERCSNDSVRVSLAAKIEELKRIAVIKTDSLGNFDFGTVPSGHYSLAIVVKDSKGSDVMDDWFDVEITDKARSTESVLIDISPVAPDCTGGHEFIEKKNTNAASN